MNVLGEVLDLHPTEARRLAGLLLTGADIADRPVVVW